MAVGRFRSADTPIRRLCLYFCQTKEVGVPHPCAFCAQVVGFHCSIPNRILPPDTTKLSIPQPSFSQTFFITFFPYAHHRLTPPIGARIPRQCTIERCNRSAKQMRQSPATNQFPALKLFTAIYNIWPRSAPSQVHAKQHDSMLSAIF